MKNIVKKQHFIPQFYIKGFAIEKDSECCYECNNYTHKVLKKKITDICIHNYTYELRKDGHFLSDEDINVFEKALSIVENTQAPELRDLLEKVSKAEDCILLSDEEKINISSFMSLMVLRNPVIKKALPKAFEIAKEEFFDTNEQLKNFHFSENKEYEIIYIWRIAISKFIEIFSKDFIKSQMTFIKAPYEEVFISSEIPFYFEQYPISKFFYMPLNSKIAIRCENSDECVLKNINKSRIENASKDDIRRYNYMVFEKYGSSFANNEKILHELQHDSSLEFLRNKPINRLYTKCYSHSNIMK